MSSKIIRMLYAEDKLASEVIKNFSRNNTESQLANSRPFRCSFLEKPNIETSINPGVMGLPLSVTRGDDFNQY